MSFPFDGDNPTVLEGERSNLYVLVRNVSVRSEKAGPETHGTLKKTNRAVEVRSVLLHQPEECPHGLGVGAGRWGHSSLSILHSFSLGLVSGLREVRGSHLAKTLPPTPPINGGLPFKAAAAGVRARGGCPPGARFAGWSPPRRPGAWLG